MKLKTADLKKTIYYLKRNGLGNTLWAVRERLAERKNPPYVYRPLEEEEAARQRQLSRGDFAGYKFSIVVPTFRTPEKYLRRMMDSVLEQTYPNLELVLADATDGTCVEDVVKTYADKRILYHKLSENAGIAPNTNCGLKVATGDYIGLLDHDDILTPDALFEMASCIHKAADKGVSLKMIYSDEDKCDGEETRYFDPHYKEDFNLDLLLSNNYICHFLVMKAELMKELRFRTAYDGAQDFDLALRGAAALAGEEQAIAHIRKVLYHWRCHAASTAENPQSKRYAYEAGGRAIADYAEVKGWQVKVEETHHLGFYRIAYGDNPLAIRQDVGALGGPIYKAGKVLSGRLDSTGKAVYADLPGKFSGYMHRAVLSQDAYALDIRNLELREELYPLFREITGVEYTTKPGSKLFDANKLPPEANVIALSLALGKAICEKGYRLLYLPERGLKL